MVDGMPILKTTCLIAFKAKAWLDLRERKLNDEHVDSKNIKKHKNDVFRKSRYRNGKDFLNLKTALIFNEIHPVLLRIPGGFSIFCNL